MRKALIAVLGAGVVMLVAAGVSTATHTYDGNAESVAVVYKGDTGAAPGGNVDCPANTIVGPKIDPGGNYSDANLTVSNYDGQTFDWAFTMQWDSRVRHGARDREGWAGVSRLHVRLRARSSSTTATVGWPRRRIRRTGRTTAISHIQFCYDPKGGRRQLSP